jgi:hypothetical protein
MPSFCWKTLKTCDEVQVTKFSPKTFELETDTDDSLSDTPVLPVFPKPPKKYEGSTRYWQRLRRPVLRPDFI